MSKEELGNIRLFYIEHHYKSKQISRIHQAEADYKMNTAVFQYTNTIIQEKGSASFVWNGIRYHNHQNIQFHVHKVLSNMLSKSQEDKNFFITTFGKKPFPKK